MIEFIKNWTARDWLSFILQLIGAGVVVVFDVGVVEAATPLDVVVVSLVSSSLEGLR